MGSGSFFAIFGGDADHREGSNCHRGVGNEVENDTCERNLYGHFEVGEDSHEEVSGVGDAGVAEGSLDVLLDESYEVTDRHRCNSDSGESGEPEILKGISSGEYSDECTHCGDLTDNAHEGGDVGGGTLIDIGSPLVERNEGGFESETNEHKGDGEHGHDECAVGGIEGNFESFEVEGSRGTVDECDSVKQECRSECAEEEVFEGRFFGSLVTTGHSREAVEGDGEDFQADEKHEKVLGANHDHGSAERPESEGIEFAEGDAALPEIAFAEQEAKGSCAQHNQLEKHGELISEDHVGDGCGWFGTELSQEEDKCGGETSKGEANDQVVVLFGAEHLDQESNDPGDEDDDGGHKDAPIDGRYLNHDLAFAS